ncbi:MAG: hypothetical protein ACERKO_10685 [Acetanaerobacterium sp.]
MIIRMNARRLTRFLKRYGRAAAITNSAGDTHTLQAVVTPLRYKNRMYTDGEYSAAGYLDGGHFAFISQYTSLCVNNGDTVAVSGARYTVKRWDTLYLGECPALICAVLSAADGGDG